MSKKLEEYTKEELLAYIGRLKKDIKFGLVWNPKDEQVAIDCETKVPVLQAVTDRTITKASADDPTHLLIEGDNYHSLSVLNYTHAGKIDVIYIDPPYNTGKDFIYNDRYVDKEDPYRHSEWLSFMDNRLRLAKNVLADTGVVFISIDDNEQAHLRILCDKIFGEENFIANFIVVRSEGGGLAKQAVIGHDYLLAYAKNITKFTPLGRPKDIRGKIVEIDGEEYWIETDWLRKEFGKYGTLPYEDIEKNRGIEKKKEIDEGIRNGLYVLIEKDKKHIVGRYRKVSEDTSKFYTVLKHLNKNGVHDLNKIGLEGFDFPKPLSLLEDIILGATIRNKNAVVLDFFAGSGTAGHAVLKLNVQDGGKRQFILGTNNENGIAENITYERISKVINGFEDVEGIPANLRYFKTDFVDTNGLSTLTDKDKLEITKEMGAMIALRENSFDQVEQTDHWQTYENTTQLTAIYFREDKTRIQDYLDKLNAQDKPVKLYVFGWGKNAGTEYASKKISVEDIPEPLIEVYKEIAK